ncbi:MAG: hypothetical protein R6W31_15495 [Bacteroidales bacterium]
MRKTKLILSIALVALALNTFGNSYNSSEVSIENDLVLENWMTTPFEGSSVDADENDLLLECWMAVPFESPSLDIEMKLECWMKVPFEVSDNQDTELWMAAAWN